MVILMLAGALAADESAFAARERDWRIGPVVYQVLVDRFAPPENLEAKRKLYQAPKSLLPWDAPVRKGRPTPDGWWSHEVEFRGGDLASLTARLDHIHGLGADTLLLNPIHSAVTNHKYDATDWNALAPEYGTLEDFRRLADELHRRKMRLVLDGVFNHVGRKHPWFERAKKDSKAAERDWFDIGPRWHHGYRCWAGAPNLPELRLDRSAVRGRIFADPDAAVRHWLRLGADGWRLDVAHQIDREVLAGITAATRATRPDGVVIGEVWNYPAGWSPPLDGILNIFLRELILNVARGDLDPETAAATLEKLVTDAGIEPLLRSWIVLDNHDTSRLATALPAADRRTLARVLQLTLPGGPCLYYGSELDLEGQGDPECRATMRWDWSAEDRSKMDALRRLLTMRRSARALRIGDIRLLPARGLVAFSRVTDRPEEAVFVLVNPGDEVVRRQIPCRDGRLMSGMKFRDALDPAVRTEPFAGFLHVSVPPRTARVFVAE